MARKQRQAPKQGEIVGRVMHEFKHGDLRSSSGRKVKNPRQAIATALHGAGSSRDETPAGNRRNLARAQAKERQGDPGAAPQSRRGRDPRRALRRGHEAGLPGRSRMIKAQLARPLGR